MSPLSLSKVLSSKETKKPVSFPENEFYLIPKTHSFITLSVGFSTILVLLYSFKKLKFSNNKINRNEKKFF